MKKTVILVIAALLVVTSMVSGVFAMYKSDIDELVYDGHNSKQFVLDGTSTTQNENYVNSVSIAPGEKVNGEFSISNFKGEIVTETAMNVTVNVLFDTNIPEAEFTVYDDKGEMVAKLDFNTAKNGQFSFSFEAGVKETRTYTYTLAWLMTDEVQNIDNGTASYKVSVVGVQG